MIGGRSTKANGIEPYEYLVAVLKQLPAAETEDDLDALLPWNTGDAIPV